MSRRRVLLLVDLSNALYRACASHLDLSYRDVFTGGLYGFMSAMAKTVRETEATDVLVCRDTKPYLRSKAYPAYKMLRAGGDAEPGDLRQLYIESEPHVLELCKVLGWPVTGLQGFEADDMIASAVVWHRSRFDAMFAASNDSDLYQLLDCKRFRIYRGGNGMVKTQVVTGDTLAESHKLTPAQYMLATALQGTHNDVEGIPGCGEVRSRAAARDPVLLRKYRDGYAEVIDRNLSLIKLPHAELPRQSLPARGPFNLRSLYRFTRAFDIQVTSGMADSFEQIDKGIIR